MAKRQKKSDVLEGKKAVVIGEMNGFCIRIDDVDAADSGDVLAGLISAFRTLKHEFPDELLPELNPVAGGAPVYVSEFFGDEGKAVRRRRKAIGFAVAEASVPTAPRETERR